MSDQKGTTGSDSAIGWMILGCVFVALFALFWYFNEYNIKSIIRTIRWGEMWVVSRFVSDNYSITTQGQSVNYSEWLNGVPSIPKQSLDDGTMSVIAALAMQPLRIPFVIILSLMAFWCMTMGPGTNYRRKLTLDGLIGVQSKVFPVIAPFVDFNPSEQPPRPPGSPVPAELPHFAEALGPEEWLAFHSIPMPDGEVDRAAAYLAFAAQLGPRWQGWDKLPAYKQILLASFCLKAARKRTEADDMVGRLAACWSHEKGFQLKDRKLLSEARKVLNNKDLSGKTIAKCNQHAWHTTALLRALLNAREEGGVLAPAQFVWLRAYDRTLWYPLNNLGRQAFHMEALGAMAHYKAEKITQRPIPRPKVEPAIDTIAAYMKSDKARPVPQLDYSKSKKSGIKKPKNSGVKKPKK